VKLGTQYCPDCDVAIEPQSPASIAARLLRDYKGKRIGLLAPLIVARKGYYTDLAKWAAKKGFRHLRVDGELLPSAPWPRLSRFREHTIELPVTEVEVGVRTEAALREALARALDYGKGLVHVLAPKSSRVTVFSTKRACPSCGKSFAELDPRLFSFNSKHGWCESCFGTGVEMPGFDAEQSGEELWWNEWYAREPQPCSGCQGERLNPTALNVRFRERSIAALAGEPVSQSQEFFARLRLGPRGEIARALREIARDWSSSGASASAACSWTAQRQRSGWRARRIRLAAARPDLRGCAVLDEPTIIAPRDNAVLLGRSASSPVSATRWWWSARGDHPPRRLRAGHGPAGGRARRQWSAPARCRT
jgi:excinuclease ABC subunit A